MKRVIILIITLIILLTTADVLFAQDEVPSDYGQNIYIPIIINNELSLRFYRDINGNGQIDPVEGFMGIDTISLAYVQKSESSVWSAYVLSTLGFADISGEECTKDDPCTVYGHLYGGSTNCWLSEQTGYIGDFIRIPMEKHYDPEKNGCDEYQ